MQLRSEIEIEAPPERVWEVITDFRRYPDWNPFLFQVDCELLLGAPMQLLVTTADGGERRLRATLTRLAAPRELGWREERRLSGFFDGEYFLQLTPLDTGKTRVVSASDYSGWFVRYMGRSLTETARGLVGMNQALKRRVERR